MKRSVGIVTIFGSFGLLLFASIWLIQLARSTSTTTTVAQIPTSSKWTMAFSDEFHTGTLDATKWTTCYDWRLPSDSGCTNFGNAEQEWYMPSQVHVQGTAATLTAVYNPVTVLSGGHRQTFPYRSGMISTGRPDTHGAVKWSGLYGYYVARIKFDAGQGVWPAFWLLPVDRSWPPEIDIMEFLGNRPNHILLTTHWKDVQGVPRENSSSITGPDFATGWHTYAVNWQPDHIDWYIDGVLKKTVTGSEVPHTRMEILFDLAMGGRLPGNTNKTTPVVRSMQIDYVRVYELKK